MALSLEIIEWGDTAACMTFVRGVVASALPPVVVVVTDLRQESSAAAVIFGFERKYNSIQ
jgi:hypothetical protein